MSSFGFKARRSSGLIAALVVPFLLSPCSGQEADSDPVGRTTNQRLSGDWISDQEFEFWREAADGERSRWVVDASTGKITQAKEVSKTKDGGLSGGPIPRSGGSSDETYIRFQNNSGEIVQLFWIDGSGRREPYASLRPGASHRQHTFASHSWIAIGQSGDYYGYIVGQVGEQEVKISKRYEMPRGGRPAQRPRPRRQRVDRDGKSDFSIRDRLLHFRTSESDWSVVEEEFLTDVEWREIGWSPDQSVFAAWKIERAPDREVYLVESSPRGGGRARMTSRPYPLPGDPMDAYELYLFQADTGQRIEVECPVIDFGRPRTRWNGQHALLVEKVDRGHQRYRLLRIDPLEKTTQSLIDEQTETFIWTIHGPDVPVLTYLSESDEAIYASERSGWRHLYLVDLSGERPLKQITSGEWLVREILSIDESTRSIDLMAGCIYPNQDPYHRHLVRIGIDDSAQVIVTQSDGDHLVQFSPDRAYVVASHRRVDLPPVHELRRVEDGELVCELARAERFTSSDSPWQLPRRFRAKGRDGKTDIWGNVHFPADFDPTAEKRYPIIEAIYAGPHSSHVPKQYRHRNRTAEEYNELGFIYVQIDGMGTANRSKAFHDVCWHNLKDAGFPDRIAWMKELAKAYPAIDASRVGVYGTSAGGQNAGSAVLFHGDFYKAAVASCGCHDNRMDKASWNEQWMGFPVAEHYAENSNIDNAEKLQGDLLLIVGEMDRNVPPESTYRLVDALIKADKDFEFLLIPGMGHSDGGSYGRRKTKDFFVKSLRPGKAQE